MRRLLSLLNPASGTWTPAEAGLHVLFLLLLAAPVAAQVPAAPAAGSNQAVDPIRCWWRTGAGAVHVGEPFDLVLTCAVLDGDDVQVVPDESRLGPSVLQLAPFEVINGTHPGDLRSNGRRFFQYQYRLRIISTDAIGTDVPIPDIVLHYKISSRMSENAALQGRDLVYLLPRISVRVASMVPADAGDIRDATGADFGLVDSLSFRARLLEIVAVTLVALGSLMTVLALVRIARRAGSRTPSDARQLTTRQLLGAASRTLTEVQRGREQGGWTDALIGEALAATRIVGACAAGLRISQRTSENGTTSQDGQVTAPGPFRGKPRIVSSPVTAEALTRALSAKDADEQAIDGLRRALATMTQARYGRGGANDQAALDAALSAAVEATSAVKRRHSWLKELLGQFRSGGRAEVAAGS